MTSGNKHRGHSHPILARQRCSYIPGDNYVIPPTRMMNLMDELTGPEHARLQLGDFSSTDFAEQVEAKLPIDMKITVVIVNLNTLHLLKNCISSLNVAYPAINCIVVDNGSTDGSREWIANHLVDNMLLDKNIGHGRAMHKAIQQVTTPFFLTLDSDTVILKAGFIEQMVDVLTSGNNQYAIGWRRLVQKHSGVPVTWSKRPANWEKKYIQYVHPYCGMYKKALYDKLPPFEHHGAPCISNMREAVKRGYGLHQFPQTNQYQLGDYVKHLTAGTRRMYPVPDWDPKDRKPGKWDPKKVLDI